MSTQGMVHNGYGMDEPFIHDPSTESKHFYELVHVKY